MTVRLGKKPYKHDPRTLMLGPLLDLSAVAVPTGYDFDSHRVPFPKSSWGNNDWGDCVMAGRANHMLRLERSERRITLPLTEKDVVEEYKNEVERESGDRPHSPGDNADQGLIVLEALKDWRNNGWDVPMNHLGTRRYTNTIQAYGRLSPDNSDQIKAAIFMLNGVQFGLNLPLSAQRQFSQERKWYVTEGLNTKPGSWGGHLVYSKRYGPKGVWVITWGIEICVTWQFIVKYCDEAWAVVDRVDDPALKHWLDVDAMMKKLQSIT
jgi:hypothetical protein